MSLAVGCYRVRARDAPSEGVRARVSDVMGG